MSAAGKVIVITGASDGIGAVAARELHSRGATVVITGRSATKTEQIAKELGVRHYLADFTRLEEVRDLADRLAKQYPRIDVLINNAGGIFGNREITIDGNEKTLQVNHLAHFLLTQLLMENLIAGSATIINTSSIANEKYGDIDIDDLSLEHGFSPNRAYGNAKLANILFTRELHRRYHDRGISAVAVHPGVISTNFASDTTSFFRFFYRTPLAKLFMQTPEKGAEPLVWLATSTPGIDWTPGGYYDRHEPGRLSNQALDADLVRRFWEQSERLVMAKAMQTAN